MRRARLFIRSVLIALFALSCVVVAGSIEPVAAEEQTQQLKDESASFKYRSESCLRMVRSKAKYYAQTIQEAILETAKRKPVVAVFSVILILVPPIFGFRVVPAILLSVAFFAANVIFEFGSFAYIIGFALGFIIVIDSVFH